MEITVVRDALMASRQDASGVFEIEDPAAPYAASVRAVLEGRQYRTRVPYGQAVFHFYHGCVMTRLQYGNRLLAFPALAWDGTQSAVRCQAQTPASRQALAEFAALPRDILIFFASLMHAVFGHRPMAMAQFPPALRAAFEEADVRPLSSRA